MTPAFQPNSNSLADLVVRLCQRPPFNRGFLRKHVIGLVERLANGPIKSRFHGVPLWFHMDNTTERKALFGHYDEAELGFLTACSLGDDKVFVDLGANSGLYSMMFLSQPGKNRTSVAIEPNPQMAARVRANRTLGLENGVGKDSRLEIVEKAVGAGEGTVTLSLEYGLGGARVVESASQTDQFEQIDVPQARLEDILRDLGVAQVDVLKIDIEGNEDKALVPFFASAPESLYPKAIIIEVCHDHLWQSPLHEVFAEKGYTLAKRNKANLMLKRG